MPKWLNMATLLAIALTVAICAFIFALGQCDLRKTVTTKANVDTARSEAFGNSAGEAVATVEADGNRRAESEAVSRRHEQEIRNAPGANDAVNPAVRERGLRALCERQAYRDDPACAVFKAHP